jgi:hypothetical protein
MLPAFMALNPRAFGRAFRSYDGPIATGKSAIEQASEPRYAPGGRARLAMLQRTAEPGPVMRLIETVGNADEFTFSPSISIAPSSSPSG